MKFQLYYINAIIGCNKICEPTVSATNSAFPLSDVIHEITNALSPPSLLLQYLVLNDNTLDNIHLSPLIGAIN